MQFSSGRIKTNRVPSTGKIPLLEMNIDSYMTEIAGFHAIVSIVEDVTPSITYLIDSSLLHVTGTTINTNKWTS